MKPARPRFSLFVYFYLVTFFLLLAFLPICLVATIGRLAISPGYWLASLIWPAVIIVLAFYAHLRCSSDRMPFRDGLLWVTASMMTGGIHVVFHCLAGDAAGILGLRLFRNFRGSKPRSRIFPGQMASSRQLLLSKPDEAIKHEIGLRASFQCYLQIAAIRMVIMGS